MQNFQQNPDSSENTFFDAAQCVCIGELDVETQKFTFTNEVCKRDEGRDSALRMQK